MVKTVFFKILRFLFIVLLACVTFVLGYVIYTAGKETVKAFGPAVSKLWGFVASNPLLVVIILVCLLIASIFYDKLVKILKKKKKQNEQQKSKS